MADLTSLYADRASLGVTDTLVPTSPLRLVGTPAASVGALRLALDGNGNVTSGVLVAGDIPSSFPQRDVAEIIGGDWTWSAGKTIAFAPGPLAAPAATSRSLGTRLVVEPVPGSTEYAVGRESGGVWTSTPIGGKHAWYTGATERLRLDADGTVKVLNGTGGILLAAASTGDGALVAQASLQIRAGTGGITLETAERRIVPRYGYTENLGELTRKYLTLHAAELWVETLVAQDTLATIGGRVLVGSTTVLTRDVAVGDSVIYVKHNAFGLYEGGIEYGSKLVLQSGGKFEVMRVLDPATPIAETAGDYRYSVERNADGSGANAWYAGDAIFDTGKWQGGPVGAFIDLYSVRGLRSGTTAGPTIVGNVRTGPGATEWRERWSIGNLKGLYGQTADRFGAAFGDPTGVHVMVDSTDGFTIRAAGGTGGPASAILGQWSMANILSLGYGATSQIQLNPTDGSFRLRYNGVDKITLLSDGVANLYTGLVVGNASGSVAYIRTATATDWNAGSGFYVRYTYASNQTVMLLGNSGSPKRCIQWDGASLKIYQDGFTLDELGITLGQNTTGGVSAGRVIQFGSGSGGYMWDTTVAGDPKFEILRGSHKIAITAQSSTNGVIELMAGGSSVDRVILQLIAGGGGGAGTMVLGGQSFGGSVWPHFLPATTQVQNLGSGTKQWLNVYAWRIALGVASAVYHIELGGDSAAKPVSSTWTIVSDGRAKRDVIAVDPDDALAIVRQVPVIRYQYTGEYHTPASVRGIGVIAQDVASLLPLSVTTRPDNGALAWNAHELFMLNVAAVQSLAARLDALEGKATR